MRFVFFGTDDFSSAILEKLMSDFYFPLLVVTQPDRPVGRKQVLTPPKIKRVCEDHQIPLLQTDDLKQAQEQLKELKPDLFIVASFGQIIPQSILDIPYLGSVNVHTSLLPMYRGSSPIQAAILDGLEETGITIMFMDDKMDHGPILFQQAISIDSRETGPSLFNKLAQLGADSLSKCLPDIVSGKLKAKEQDHDKATFVKMIKKEDAKLDWNSSNVVLDRMIRAYDEWPVAWTILPNNKRVKIFSATLSEDSLKPGLIKIEKEKATIGCGKGSLILDHVQVEGAKSAISGEEFARGYTQFDGKEIS